MSKELRQRLEALSEAAHATNVPELEVWKLIEAEHSLRNALQTAYELGDLVTRTEMEEAVAKAVAEERAACAELAEEHTDWHPVNIPVAHHIRARSSNKEGERCDQN